MSIIRKIVFKKFNLKTQKLKVNKTSVVRSITFFFRRCFEENWNMATSFKKTNSQCSKILQITGARPSLFNNQLLISTGVPSFDNILGKFFFIYLLSIFFPQYRFIFITYKTTMLRFCFGDVDPTNKWYVFT